MALQTDCFFTGTEVFLNVLGEDDIGRIDGFFNPPVGKRGQANNAALPFADI